LPLDTKGYMYVPAEVIPGGLRRRRFAAAARPAAAGFED
jgi:hypothetical protein